MKDILGFIKDKISLIRHCARKLAVVDWWSDRAFLSQATNSVALRAEIARLTRVRRNYSMFFALLFLWGAVTGCIDRHPDVSFWIIMIISLLVLQDIHNRLRMLQLAGKIQAAPFPRNASA